MLLLLLSILYQFNIQIFLCCFDLYFCFVLCLLFICFCFVLFLRYTSEANIYDAAEGSFDREVFECFGCD